MNDITDLSIVDGVRFLGFALTFGMGLVVLSFAVAVSIYIVHAAINGDHRRERRER